MRRLSLQIVLIAALAVSQAALAQAGDDCKNHFILRDCSPCPLDAEIGPPIAVVMQNDRQLALVTELRAIGEARLLKSMAVVRTVLSPDGTEIVLDDTWGDCGVARVPIWGGDDMPRAIVLQPDGRLLVLGNAPDPTEYMIDDYMLEPHYYIAVIRLDPDGTIDRTFADKGRRVLRVGREDYSLECDANGRSFGLKLLDDGRIVVLSGPNFPMEQLGADGSIIAVYPCFPGQQAIAFGLDATLEYFNVSYERYLTSDPDEAVMLDRGGVWYRTGNAFGTPTMLWPTPSR